MAQTAKQKSGKYLGAPNQPEFVPNFGECLCPSFLTCTPNIVCIIRPTHRLKPFPSLPLISQTSEWVVLIKGLNGCGSDCPQDPKCVSLIAEAWGSATVGRERLCKKCLRTWAKKRNEDVPGWFSRLGCRQGLSFLSIPPPTSDDVATALIYHYLAWCYSPSHDPFIQIAELCFGWIVPDVLHS